MKKVFKTMAFTLLGLVLSVNVMAADVTYKWTFPFSSSVTNADLPDDAKSGATMGAYTSKGVINNGSWTNVTKGSYFSLNSHFLIKIPISSSTTSFTLKADLFAWKSSKYTEKTVTITYYTSKSSSENAICNGSTTTSGCYSVDEEITLSSTLVEDKGTLYIKIAMAQGNDGFESLSVTTTEAGDDPSCTSRTITFAGSPTTVEKTTADVPFKYVASIDVADGQTIGYSSSDTKVATVAADGTVTIVGTGTTKITASVPATDTYCEASASYTVNVTKPVFSCWTGSLNCDFTKISGFSEWGLLTSSTLLNIPI